MKEKQKYKNIMLIGLAISCISLFALMNTTSNALVIVCAILGVITTTVFAIFGAEIIDAEVMQEDLEDFNSPEYDFEEPKKLEFITLNEETWGK